MATATMTLIGMYNFDNTLFNKMSLPTGINATMTRSAILARSGEFETIYPDLEFNREMIGFISSKWYDTFEKWYKALQIKYDPLYNYDRYEEWTDSGTDTGTVKRSGSNTGTVTDRGTNTGTVTDRGSNTGTVNTENSTSSKESSSGNGQTDTFVNAYNDNTLVEDGQSKSTQSASSEGSGTNNTEVTNNLSNSNTRTDNLSNSSTKTNNLKNTDDETRNLATSGKHSGHMYGNIGVTTSQQMLQAELDIAEWNLYEHIADIFVRELCIPVYG